MTDTTTPTMGEQQAADIADPSKERAALGCLLVIGLGTLGAIAVTVPETAYYMAGIGTAIGVRNTRAWFADRHVDETEEDTVDIVASLHELSPNASLNVRLTQLQDHTGLPSTLVVRSLLGEIGITPRGVRAAGKNGPGVHATDIPRSCGAPEGSCWCALTSNNNTNNKTGEEPEEGLRVQDIGEGARVYTDPTETVVRHHAITK